jgi:multiple sugar transport system permease protein
VTRMTTRDAGTAPVRVVRTRANRRREVRSAYLFVLPMLALIVVFRAVPLVVSGYLSLTNASWDGVAQFVGLANYQRLAADPLFWQSLRVTLGYVAFAMPLTVGLGLLAALLLHRTSRGNAVLRTFLFLPYVTSLVLAAVVWHWIYDTEHGLINGLLGEAGPIPFLAGTDLTLPSLAVVGAWKGFGYSMLVLLAGLRAIPAEYHEAARLDGARGWSTFRYVTLPQLRPMLLFCVIVETVSALHVFELAYVMTGGGPARSSYSLVMNLYDQGFKFFDFGYASAIGMVLTVIVVIVSMAQWRFFGDGRRR